MLKDKNLGLYLKRQPNSCFAFVMFESLTRNNILIGIWNGQVQYSAMENTVF